jgi:hypothetical protein
MGTMNTELSFLGQRLAAPDYSKVPLPLHPCKSIRAGTTMEDPKELSIVGPVLNNRDAEELPAREVPENHEEKHDDKCFSFVWYTSISFIFLLLLYLNY